MCTNYFVLDLLIAQALLILIPFENSQKKKCILKKSYLHQELKFPSASSLFFFICFLVNKTVHTNVEEVKLKINVSV